MRPGSLRIAVRGPDGEPVERLDVRGNLGRPATDASDRKLRFDWQPGGIYTARLEPQQMLGSGQWDLVAEARQAGAVSAAPFKIGTRLWVKQ